MPMNTRDLVDRIVDLAEETEENGDAPLLVQVEGLPAIQVIWIDFVDGVLTIGGEAL